VRTSFMDGPIALFEARNRKNKQEKKQQKNKKELKTLMILFKVLPYTVGYYTLGLLKILQMNFKLKFYNKPFKIIIRRISGYSPQALTRQGPGRGAGPPVKILAPCQAT